MKRLVILGGTVHDTALLRKICKQEKFGQVIAADSGLNWAYQLGIRPDLIMGDFDSVDPDVLSYYKKMQIPEKVFPTRKDFTDSELALWAALAAVTSRSPRVVITRVSRSTIAPR